MTDEEYEELEDVLTDKQYNFVLEYLKDFNGARAARVAGYCPLSPQNSRVVACRLLTNEYIKAFIKSYKEDLAKEVKITKNDILSLCREIMEAKPTDYYDNKSYQIEIDKESPNQRAIQSLTLFTQTDKDGNTIKNEKLIMRDPLKAAQLAAKILGLDETDDSEDLSIEVTVTHLAAQKKAIDTVISEETIETVVEFDDSEVSTPEISIKINKK